MQQSGLRWIPCETKGIDREMAKLSDSHLASLDMMANVLRAGSRREWEDLTVDEWLVLSCLCDVGDS